MIIRQSVTFQHINSMAMNNGINSNKLVTCRRITINRFLVGSFRRIIQATSHFIDIMQHTGRNSRPNTDKTRDSLPNHCQRPTLSLNHAFQIDQRPRTITVFLHRVRRSHNKVHRRRTLVVRRQRLTGQISHRRFELFIHTFNRIGRSRFNQRLRRQRRRLNAIHITKTKGIMRLSNVRRQLH